MLEETLYLKANFPKYSHDEMVSTGEQVRNEFDWTVTYSIRSTSEMDKKQYQTVLLKVLI
jgi:hypothetical protein